MDNLNKPKLYSKVSLMVFSAFSCFFAGLLYIQNLRELRKNKFVLPTLLFSIFFPTLMIKALTSFGVPMYYSFIPINLLGGFLLIKPFWDSQIETNDYKNKSIVGPAVVVVGLIGIIILLIRR
jgi:cellulose synthase/poly-beta-1,6-N-acetylglucosamine synthase-like glycosyltransferase